MLICSVYSENASNVSAIDSTAWTIKLLASEGTFVDADKTISSQNEGIVWTWADSANNVDYKTPAVGYEMKLRSATNNNVTFKCLETIVSSVLRSPEFDFSKWFSSNEGTLFVVQKQLSEQNGAAINWNLGNATNRFGTHITYGGNIYYDHSNADSVRVFNATDASSWNIFELTRQGSVVKIIKNGVLIASRDNAVGSFSSAMSPLEISRNTDAQYYAFLNSKTYLADDVRAQVRAELAARVGITL